MPSESIIRIIWEIRPAFPREVSIKGLKLISNKIKAKIIQIQIIEVEAVISKTTNIIITEAEADIEKNYLIN